MDKQAKPEKRGRATQSPAKAEKAKKATKPAEENTYAKMTWPGLIGYVLDRHLVNVVILALMLLLPGCFLFMYKTAQSDALQRDILLKAYEVISRISPITWVGWVLVPLLVIVILYLRDHYKKEIHRIANEKTRLHEQLQLHRQSSGHVESDLA